MYLTKNAGYQTHIVVGHKHFAERFEVGYSIEEFIERGPGLPQIIS